MFGYILINIQEKYPFCFRLHVKVDWSHMDALIESSGDKWCVGTYLVEYGPHKYERRKRESVSNSADVSPSLGRDISSWTLVVEASQYRFKRSRPRLGQGDRSAGGLGTGHLGAHV